MTKKHNNDMAIAAELIIINLWLIAGVTFSNNLSVAMAIFHTISLLVIMFIFKTKTL